MKKHRFLISIFVLSCTFVCNATTPPAAKEIPYKMVQHRDVRIDPYFWLRDLKNPEVLDYLKSENSYAEDVLKPTEQVQMKLFEEMKARIKQEDTSYPVQDSGYLYYVRTEKNKEYAIFCRKKLGSEKEEILLDVNILAKGFDSFQTTGPLVSDDGNTMAYAVDTTGKRIFTIYFKNLLTGEVLPEQIPNVTGDMAWAADNKTLFYSKQNPTTLRSEWIYRHELGKPTETLVFHESDEEFNAEIVRSLTRRYLFIISQSKDTTEYRHMLAANPSDKPTLFEPRRKGLEYYVKDGMDRFFIRTNWRAQNFRLVETPIQKTARHHWKQLIGHNKNVYLEQVLVLKDHLVLAERESGLSRLRTMDRATGQFTSISFHDPAYVVQIGENREYTASSFRYTYESPTTPDSTFDYSFADKSQTLRKQQSILGNFKPEDYVCLRLFAKAKDGTQIPVILVYRRTTTKSAQTPLLIYGYGSYGQSIEPTFNHTRLSLLDRGFIFAIAQIRGGSEMGRGWYENGKLFKKKNTFTDFIAATEFLHAQGFSSPSATYAKGESAGGLLMGAVLNQRPDLYHGVLAGVPFVDVLTTMLDETLPLTTEEYSEWGNPNHKKDYEYIKSYSPYDNVKKQSYPHLFVETGINDTQVGYWEPAKWVAKLRKTKTDQNLLLLRTELEVGHSGKSGRFEYLKELAREQAFLLLLAEKEGLTLKANQPKASK